MALVCSIARQIGVCLEHLHQRGLLHADLKPLNIMRVDGTWRLIDLDAAALLPSEGAAGDAADEEHERKRAEELDCTVYAGAKFSSAFVPPELVDLHGGQGGGGNHILARVKTFMTDGKGKALTDGLPYGLVRARASHDLWAFGAVLYHLG
jgi:serine/threonine protein kinase